MSDFALIDVDGPGGCPMRPRNVLAQLASSPMGSGLLTMVLVLMVTTYFDGLVLIYGQDCVGSRSDLGNNNGDNRGGSELSSALSCDDGEAAIGAQPRASDTAHKTMGARETFLGQDGVLEVRVTGSGELELTHDPVDPADSPGPVAPFGLRQLRAANLRLLPLDTRNRVDITLRYTDADLSGPAESGVRMFYYDAGHGTWMEAPVTIDTAANAVTWTNATVGAFVERITRIAIFV